MWRNPNPIERQSRPVQALIWPRYRANAYANPIGRRAIQGKIQAKSTRCNQVLHSATTSVLCLHSRLLHSNGPQTQPHRRIAQSQKHGVCIGNRCAHLDSNALPLVFTRSINCLAWHHGLEYQTNVRKMHLPPQRKNLPLGLAVLGRWHKSRIP